MKTIQGKYYQCEYCGRKMFGAGAMVRHEKYCTQNPHNCDHYKREINYNDRLITKLIRRWWRVRRSNRKIRIIYGIKPTTNE